MSCLTASEAGADRNAVAKALGSSDYIGLKAHVLVGEPAAGAAIACLHFIQH